MSKETIITLGSAPIDSTPKHHPLCPLNAVTIQPVGVEFMARARRVLLSRTLIQDLELEMALLEAGAEDLSLEDDEPETKELLKSDPAKWKDQDHYAILGLSKKRFEASEEDIKRAYRRKVLKHHPDKKKSKTKKEDDSFFKCIQKAWEVLSDPRKRREWDSCDPEFDESIPSVRAKGDFFTVYGPAFKKEARFSKKESVPDLGSLASPREHVEAFYNFWFDFDSWRSFERMDEEDPDSAECREEKRYIERMNKAARQKLKKEDIARVNRLVEQAFSLDPRIKLIKQEEKKAKEAKKLEKLAVQKAAELEAKKAQELELQAKALAEEQEKLKAAAEKKDREAAKNANRKEKKTIKRILRDYNNFLSADASPLEIECQLTKLDDIFNYYGTSELEVFRKKLESEVEAERVHNLLLVFDEEHLLVQEALENQKKSKDEANAGSESQKTQQEVKKPWTPKETTVLIKAVKMFPGGTMDRWTKISDYVNEHGSENPNEPGNRSAKECISWSKQVQQAASEDRAKLQASAQKPVSKVVVKEEPSTRIPQEKSTPSEQEKAFTSMATSTIANNANPEGNWTFEQQKALEEALRKYPAASFYQNPPERWNKVAEAIPGKNKKQVKARVKELADMAKTRK